MDIAPLTKQVAIQKGFKWHDEESSGAFIGDVYRVPDSILDVQSDVTQKILQCESSGKLYKIIPPELKFYQTAGIPLPKRAPEQRHRDRLKRRNPRYLRKTHCANCAENIFTSQPTHIPNKVLCEKCYLNELQ